VGLAAGLIKRAGVAQPVAVPAAVGRAAAPAPGAPGVDDQYLPADKSGFGTATTAASTV
jgi:glucoamylase